MTGVLRSLGLIVAAHAAGGGVAMAAFLGSDVFLPMAGRQAGVHPSNWYTAVWIHNPGTAPATARIYLLERGTANLNPPWADVEVAAGETELIDNAVETLFSRQVFGALRVTCATQDLLVSSRVYSREAGAGARDSVGQDFAGVPASFAIGLGERTTILGVHQTQPSESSDFRYNFGFVETTGHPATVRVRAFNGDNDDQGFVDLQVREWSQRQVAFRDHFQQVSTVNSRLEVEVIAGTGKVISYGSLISNGAQDPTTFEASVALPPAAFPSGAVMMFDLAACPAGWTELVAARGRAIVAVPAGGTLAGTVGAALSDLEDRPHAHVVDPDPWVTTATGDHSHTTSGSDAVTTSVSAHSHLVDVPVTESVGVSAHSHTVAATPFTTLSAGFHKHEWASYEGGANHEWWSHEADGDPYLMIGTSNGLDMSGSGTYPIALSNPPGPRTFHTDNASSHWHDATVPQRTTSLAGIHAHNVNPAEFASATAGAHGHDVTIVPAATTTSGTHFHDVDTPGTQTTAAATSGVLPYIQLLACRKD
jgi:hypothetical protein